MKKLGLEKKIIKLDRDIEALGLAKKYLSNGEEIEQVKINLNRERQLLVFELYGEDQQAHEQCMALIEPMLNQELHQAQQIALLDEIKMLYGRRFPDISKSSNGLNAWLNKLCVTCNWINKEDSNWAILVMTALH